jgi:thiol-disulfide isomerase/thioredoxin
MIAPVLEKMAKEYAGKLIVAKVNTDENPQWASQYGVQGIPTLLFVANGKVLHTMVGFRGEALPSITSVSRTTLATRTAWSPHGYFITMEAGEVVERGKRGMPPGTIVEVKDIFFNTPARKKFLKKRQWEQRRLQ